MPAIRHFHISHNAPYLPPNILHKDCFLFLLGPPGEMKNKGYAKFGRGGGSGGNKVHYGKCESGEWSNSCVKNSLRFSDFPLHMLIKAHFYHESCSIRLTQCCTQFANSNPLGIKRFVIA